MYYNHFAILSGAVFTLLKDDITYEEVDHANSLFNQFVSDYEELYGKRCMTYNVHLFTQLVGSIVGIFRLCV